MSYILEALKKSQQERGLGQVPTIETLPAVAETGGPTGINYWGVAAVSLAGLAVLIALYAALRGAPNQETVSPKGVLAEQSGPEEAPIVSNSSHELLPPTPLLSQEPTREEAQPNFIDEPQQQPPSSPPQVQEPVRELARTETHPSPPPREPAVAPKPEDKVPEDLRQEIEAFKQELRDEQADQRKQASGKLPPHKLRLPREVEERLPAFLMTVHIYDKEPAKRFVLINARRLREGDQTRQGIAVEEILPSGVVLSYEGHRFFRHR